MPSTPVLALPNFDLPFTLETDASGSGLGAVLMHQGKPIAYYSQALGPKTSTQSTYHKEALAILQALKRWRHYFIGGKLIIKTDQQSLKYMMNQRLTEGIQHKLLMKLLEFDYTIDNKKGKENCATDTLSRREHTMSAVSLIIPTWISKVEASYSNDKYFTTIMQQLLIDAKAAEGYTIHSGIIRYKGRICISNAEALKTKILSSLHSSAIGGHSGITTTYQRVKRIFYWPNMKNQWKSSSLNVRYVIEQKVKPVTTLVYLLLYQFPTWLGPLFLWTL
jgi:hypothetical protein